MNLSDLFVVIAIVSGLYGVIVAMARQRHFLTQAVNPYRRSWFVAGFTLLWVGMGTLNLQTKTWDVRIWLKHLSPLVNDQPMSFQGKMATVAIFAGVLFLVLLLFCVLTMPRDPSTFYKPEHRVKAFRYYISRLSVGLDYAVLMRNEGDIIEEAWCEKQLKRLLPHLPPTKTAQGPAVRTIGEQVAAWRTTAVSIHKHMATLDQVITPAQMGPNIRLVFDIEFGGMFFIYMHTPYGRNQQGDYVYLFGATLSQEYMNTKVADQHFALMVKALRNIDNNIRGA